MNIAILTINDNNNFGNRLQNYALQQFLKKFGNVNTIINNTRKYDNTSSIIASLKKLKFNFLLLTNKRYKYFFRFNKLIKFYDKKISENKVSKKLNNEFDYFVVGSDQVWNPKLRRFSNIDFLNFSSNEKKISYAASIGISDLNSEEQQIFKKGLKNFKNISVREDSAKDIISKVTNRTDISVNIDPTMLLTSKDWDKVSKKPNMLKSNRFILNYFLGDLSNTRKKEIERIAKENNCEIINILDKKSPFYACGPSEFLYLEKNAFLICTDSFHSSVFAILFNRPFIIFDREGKANNMFSRIETLLKKFKLKNRKYNGKKITKENLEHDYTEAYKILEKERKKSDDYLRKALDIKDSE